MEWFFVGQQWIMSDAVYGTFFGEVIEISGGGESGTVIITDDQGNVIDTFSGSAAAFRASGEWQVMSRAAG